MSSLYSPDLFMMLGYPGAGKSTASELVEELTGAKTVSVDDLRSRFEVGFSPKDYSALYAMATMISRQMLLGGFDVIYDGNWGSVDHRLPMYDICRGIGATPRLLHIVTDRETSKERVLARPGCDHLIPEGYTAATLFDRVADRFELPTPEEKEYLIEVTPEELTLEGVGRALRQAEFHPAELSFA